MVKRNPNLVMEWKGGYIHRFWEGRCHPRRGGGDSSHPWNRLHVQLPFIWLMLWYDIIYTPFCPLLPTKATPFYITQWNAPPSQPLFSFLFYLIFHYFLSVSSQHKSQFFFINQPKLPLPPLFACSHVGTI